MLNGDDRIVNTGTEKADIFHNFFFSSWKNAG